MSPLLVCCVALRWREWWTFGGGGGGGDDDKRPSLAEQSGLECRTAAAIISRHVHVYLGWRFRLLLFDGVIKYVNEIRLEFITRAAGFTKNVSNPFRRCTLDERNGQRVGILRSYYNRYAIHHIESYLIIMFSHIHSIINCDSKQNTHDSRIVICIGIRL